MGHPVQPPCPSSVTYSRLHRTLSRRVWNISREGDSTTSLGSLGQCSVTLRGKKFFPVFRRNFLCPSSCPLLTVVTASQCHFAVAQRAQGPTLGLDYLLTDAYGFGISKVLGSQRTGLRSRFPLRHTDHDSQTQESYLTENKTQEHPYTSIHSLLQGSLKIVGGVSEIILLKNRIFSQLFEFENH